jgi:hypothetical protein
MKRLVLFLLVLGAGVSLFAQIQLPEYQFASGSWRFVGDRLYQSDAKARLAKLNLRVPQNGPMIYEFNVRYEGGGEDLQGGFGLHIFVDNVLNRESWGSGESYLLWLNYDENPITRGIPKGFSAQIYRSYSQSRMDLVESFDLNEYAYVLTWENLAYTVPVRIWVDGNTGEVRVYDPSDPYLEGYFYFYLDRRFLPLRGNWVSLRTNGLAASFGMGLN